MVLKMLINNANTSEFFRVIILLEILVHLREIIEIPSNLMKLTIDILIISRHSYYYAVQCRVGSLEGIWIGVWAVVAPSSIPTPLALNPQP